MLNKTRRHDAEDKIELAEDPNEQDAFDSDGDDTKPQSASDDHSNPSERSIRDELNTVEQLDVNVSAAEDIQDGGVIGERVEEVEHDSPADESQAGDSQAERVRDDTSEVVDENVHGSDDGDIEVEGGATIVVESSVESSVDPSVDPAPVISNEPKHSSEKTGEPDSQAETSWWSNIVQTVSDKVGHCKSSNICYSG